MRRMCSASIWSSVTGSAAARLCLVRVADLRRQVGQLDDGAGGENDAPLDGVAQLADVAGPGVAEQGISHRLGKPRDRLAVLPGEEPQQVLGQRQDVARPLAQRRQRSLR